MSVLLNLRSLLQASVEIGNRPLPTENSIDEVISTLQKRVGFGLPAPTDDLQRQAVYRFWNSQRIENLKEARLVSFGLCIKANSAGDCIMEDRQRFRAVLDNQVGVGQWLNEPRLYRRCHQGLIRSYFTYDSMVDDAPAVGKKNWSDLRDYLSVHTADIKDERLNPDWVSVVLENSDLFSENPYQRYVTSLLDGNTALLDNICSNLGVTKDSWFLRELILAQVRQAISRDHNTFISLLPRLLQLLTGNEVIRDRGLVLILNRYARISEQALNQTLQDFSVKWWGNPWLPSNRARWGGVEPETKEMVSNWLKREFIEAFFSKLAKDGVGDKRRANFWLKYVKSMSNIQFALGSTARSSNDKDFVVLRKKMEGLHTALIDSNPSNNAFVMTIGDLVAVEFGGMGNAFYGYDTKRTLPFDMSKPVLTTKNIANSLKHDSHILWMRHQDGIKGWNRWEEMFEATLNKHFHISPQIERMLPDSLAVTSTSPPTQQSIFIPPVIQKAINDEESQFSYAALKNVAAKYGLKIEDNITVGGNLWVRTDNQNIKVNKILRAWNFIYKPRKGWWKSGDLSD